MLGLYLPLRFRAGKPFPCRSPWRAMEVGLSAMSSTFGEEVRTS